MGLILETRTEACLLLTSYGIYSGGERNKYSNKVLRIAKTCMVDPSQHQKTIEDCLSWEWKDFFLLISADHNL